MSCQVFILLLISRINIPSLNFPATLNIWIGFIGSKPGKNNFYLSRNNKLLIYIFYLVIN